MRLKILVFITIILLPLVSSSSSFNNATELRIKSLNTTITFSLNTTIDYLRINQNSIYILNATTSLGLCPSVNYSTPNSTLDSSEFCLVISPGGGGVSPEILAEKISLISVICPGKTYSDLYECIILKTSDTMYRLGNIIWPANYKAGTIILFILLFLLVTILTKYRRRWGFIIAKRRKKHDKKK